MIDSISKFRVLLLGRYIFLINDQYSSLVFSIIRLIAWQNIHV